MRGLKNRVTIISEENFLELSELYGEINVEDLQRIVNKHVAVAVEEIKEDIGDNKLRTLCD